jgi:hypothetical protein
MPRARSTTGSATNMANMPTRPATPSQGIAGNLRDKSLEDLVEGTRSIVRKSPAVTVGTAALLGFVLVRLVKSGLEAEAAAARRRRSGEARRQALGGGNSGGGNSGGGA